ncbi:MAG TPA: MarR family transcriptional regulator [Ramlibacter sp.]|nr:MarR family transcriptional regulator [Ramlibacter sp.]
MESMHGVMHLYRAHRMRALRSASHELAPMEGKALGFFARHPGATLSELAAHSGRDKGQLARLIAGLRERGLLEAVPDAADRRTVRLQPTADGQAMHQALRRHGRRIAAIATAQLSADERQQLLALMAKIRAALEAAEA